MRIFLFVLLAVSVAAWQTPWRRVQRVIRFRPTSSFGRSLASSAAASSWEDSKPDTRNKQASQTELTGFSVNPVPKDVVMASESLSDAASDEIPPVEDAGRALSDKAWEEEESALRFGHAFHDLSLAAVVGLVSGLMIALFKLSIEGVRRVFYEESWLVMYPWLIPLIPAMGGLLVGILLLMGSFPPGLRDRVEEVDEAAAKLTSTPRLSVTAIAQRRISALRKSLAAVITLGTGCSLGPEGPCVEIGMSVSQACMDATTPDSYLPTARQREGWNRRLLACGAASGVAAGFNAPISGVFFALEVMGNTFAKVTNDRGGNLPMREGESVGKELSATERISPILVSSVLSALAARALLGDHFVLQLSAYSLKNPLIELPLYMLLGVVAGGVAFTFSEFAKLSQGFFNGQVGPLGVREFMGKLPIWTKPMIGGLFCGIVGIFFPQILFFGYETLNSLLAKSSLPVGLILSLLFIKTTTTAVSAGSGLIGGTFAPALFLGAMTGAAFHNGFSYLFDTVLELQRFSFFHGMADLRKLILTNPLATLPSWYLTLLPT
jgi:H+/Cl- antiporter ClcA